MSGGFFRGTSADQDTRFSNKQAKLLKSQKFAPELEHLVDMSKVKMDVMRPWIATRVTELLGFEDEVLLNFIYTLLEGKEVNGKEVQIALTGFMEKNTGRFMKELWTLLLSAQNTGSGIPQQFLDAKKEELEKKQVDDRRIKNEIQKKEESKEIRQERSKKMDDGIGTKFSNPDIDLASRSLQRKGSSDNSGDDRETVKRNGLRGRNRISQSPNSADRLAPSPRGSPTRSDRSLSCSRSYSGQKSRSVSRSPRMRRPSISPRGRSISPQNRRPRISLSPSRRRQSYSRRRSRSPSSSRSPPMRHRLGSYRRRSPSPIRRTSPSPRHRRSPSPLRSRRTPSPVRRRRSPLPIHRRRSPSPIRRRRSPSPIRRRRSPSPIRRRRSPSPIRHRRSPSPIRCHRSPSPVRHYRSPSPVRSHRTPVRSYRSRSPVRRRRSPSPIQHRSPPRIRHSSPSPTYHRSPSPRRMLGSADHGLSSPMRHGSRYSPHHDSLTSEGGRSLLPQRRSVSPYRRRHQRSASTPGSRSASPMLSRSPPRRRPTPHDRSASPYGSSSPSPVRHASSPMNRISLKDNRKSPKKNRKSPRGTLGERVRTREDLVPALHRPSSPLRSAHKESNDLASKRPKSPIPVKTKGSIEDGSPYESPIGQSGRRLVHDDGTSKKSRELKPRQDSPVTSEEEDAKYIRERRVHKSRSSQNPSSRTTVVSEQKDSQVGVHTKTENSSKGGLNIHHDPSEKSSDRGVHSTNSDEKDRRKSSNIKADHARHGSDVMVSVVEKVDHSNGKVALDSDPDEGKKHRDESKEKKRQRRSHRREVSSEDDESYDSEIEDRKEAKRRRKEEKKLRKEEKRRRREERRRRKEARRAEKLKLKDDHSSDSDDVGKDKSHRSDSEDAQDEQKKLEIELRKKALELYQAKKRSSR